MNKITNHIVSTFFIIALLLNSCDNTVNPIESKSLVVKSETKVLVDISTSKELNKIYYKEFDIKSNIISYTEYNSLGNISSQSEYIYKNQERNEIKLVYDDNGNKIKSEYNSYTYNLSDGNLVKLTKLDFTGNVIGVTSYTYDGKGNLLKEYEVSSSSNATLSEKNFVYTYNSNGNLEGLTVKDALSNTIISKDSIAFISTTNVLEKYNIDLLGNVTKVNRLYYNNSGRITKETESDKNGQITRKYLYKYTFF